MRLLNVYHHARGGDFARLCPELAAWTVPVLRIALRTVRADCDPPRTPVIAHPNHDNAHPEAMVWTLDPAVPTLVRPRRWLDGTELDSEQRTGRRVELATDTGPYLVPVLSAAQAAVACRRLRQPADPSRTGEAEPVHRLGRLDAVDALHDAYLRFGGLPAPSTGPAEIARVLAALTVCADLWPAILAGLLQAANGLDEHDFTCAPLPDVTDWYGGGAAGACAAAADALNRAIADLSPISDLLSDAHLHLDRLHPRTGDTHS